MTTRVKSKAPDQSLQVKDQPPVPLIEEAAPAPVPLAWLTLENLLYGLVALVALTLRLWHLGGYPLSDTEAQQSLVAWQLYQGQPLEVSGYSPLLVSLNLLTFFLFQDSDFTARLASALLGTALVLLPLTLRRQVGSEVALLTAALLAISPIATFLSRTVNSEIAVVVAGLMLISGFFNWVEDGRQRWLFLFAGGLAMLLTAGPMAYALLVVLGLMVLIKWTDFKAYWQRGRRFLGPAASSNSHGGEDGAIQGEDPTPLSALRRPLIFFLVALFLLATAITFNLSGFGVTTNLFIEWLRRFGTEPRLDAGFNTVFLLAIYEPLLVIAGLVGLAYALLSRNLLWLLLVGWFIGTLILDLLIVGRPNGSVILALTPLAFLAALALAELWLGLRRGGSWNNEGIILASGLVIAVFGYIGLTGWLVRPCGEGETFCQLAWLQAVAALLLLIVIAAFFWLTTGNSALAWRGLSLVGVVVGLLFTLNLTWRLNYGPLMNLAYHPLAGVPASPELVQLKEIVTRESLIRARDRNLLDITALNPLPPTLHWQLRRFDNLNFANNLSELFASNAIITPVLSDPDVQFGDAYLGQDFKVNALWSPVGLEPKDFISWLIYRVGKTPPAGHEIILWLKLTPGGEAGG